MVVTSAKVWPTVAAFVLLLCGSSTLALYSSSDDVVALTASNFDKAVLRSDEIWVVEFYASFCGHCKNLVPEYRKAATALKGVIKVGAVNCEEEQALCGQHGVNGYPTIKIFGQNKKSPSPYNGQRTAKDIAEAALAEAKKKIKSVLGGGGSSGGNSGDSDAKDVIELTDANFDKLVLQSDDVWLVEFFAPWCGHCKNLAPHWEKAASELKGKVKLGAVDATVHQQWAAKYGVQGYPTIKYFPGGTKDRNTAEDYDGGRTASDIVTWALEKYSDNVPAPEIVQITSQDIVQKECENQKPACVIAVLPHILDCDAACRNQYLGILARLGDKYKKKQWGWLWTEGVAQPDLESTLNIGGFGYPALAVTNYRKKKYSLLRGSFSEDGINEFLRDISFGRGHTLPLGDKAPTIVTVDPWDGKDGQLPEEEEYDLSDVNLDDKDEL